LSLVETRVNARRSGCVLDHPVGQATNKARIVSAWGFGLSGSSHDGTYRWGIGLEPAGAPRRVGAPKSTHSCPVAYFVSGALILGVPLMSTRTPSLTCVHWSRLWIIRDWIGRESKELKPVANLAFSIDRQYLMARSDGHLILDSENGKVHHESESDAGPGIMVTGLAIGLTR